MSSNKSPFFFCQRLNFKRLCESVEGVLNTNIQNILLMLISWRNSKDLIVLAKSYNGLYDWFIMQKSIFNSVPLLPLHQIYNTHPRVLKGTSFFMPAYHHSSMYCASNSVAGMEEIQFALSVKVKIPPKVLLGIIAQFTAPWWGSQNTMQVSITRLLPSIFRYTWFTIQTSGIGAYFIKDFTSNWLHNHTDHVFLPQGQHGCKILFYQWFFYQA